MHDKDIEPFSNPLAPPTVETSRKDVSHHQSVDLHPLTNDDFRKLLMTPRVGPMSTPAPGQGSAASVHGSTRGVRGPKTMLKHEVLENRKKKKKFYATLKKHEDDTLAELAKRYRDRARERRDGENPDYGHDQDLGHTNAYRAVAPQSDVKMGIDAAERRKQAIQESKFLGGDMQHTHLVKGLDYALLQKVRSEIQYKEKDETIEQENDEETKRTESGSAATKTTLPDVPDVPLEPNDPFAIRSRFAQNIVQTLTSQLPKRNDLFLPGRMAYHVDLEDECAESDIPTTLIRSKAECPHLDSINTLSTNDIVINKLTQILSYLREGGAVKKLKKNKEKVAIISGESSKYNNRTDFKGSKPVKTEDSIYGDIGDYVPDLKRRDRERDKDHRDRHRDDRHVKSHRDRERERTRDRDRDRDHRSHNYFDKHRNEVDDDTRNDRDVKSIAASAIRGSSIIIDQVNLKSKLSAKLESDTIESYAECYPGAPENDDAVLDSDDEVDYSKMDLGNKKGLIGRWDFDTAEEYGTYMSNKEAMPKAAFQYGVKMADGRKTRRVQGKRDEKTKLDRDLQKINAIIAKRKADTGDGGGGSINTPIVEYKRHREMR